MVAYRAGGEVRVGSGDGRAIEGGSGHGFAGFIFPEYRAHEGVWHWIVRDHLSRDTQVTIRSPANRTCSQLCIPTTSSYLFRTPEVHDPILDGAVRLPAPSVFYCLTAPLSAKSCKGTDGCEHLMKAGGGVEA